jgi:hypothetical protein
MARTMSDITQKPSPQRPIPVTVLTHFYRLLKVMSHKERLETATWLTAHPEIVDQWFKRSVDRIARDFAWVDDPFHPKRRPERLGQYKRSTIASTPELVAWIAACPQPDGIWTVLGEDGLDFAFVDYEVPPLRTPSVTKFEDGLLSTSGMKMDLLLRSRDGTPIVGEAKVSTSEGDDKDPFFALMQALALAAQLLTPSQLERLRQHYPEAGFSKTSAADIFVLLFKPSQSAKATYQADLYEQAVSLSEALQSQPALSKRLRRLRFIEAQLDGQDLRFTRSPLHG